MRLLVMAWIAASFCISPALASDSSSELEMDLQEIIAELENRDLSAQEIRSTESFARLDVVDLSVIVSADERSILDETLRSTEDGWAMVQTAILENDLLETELEKQSVPLGRVVAATMSEEGVLTIYIR